MGEVPLSLHIKAEVARDLEDEARLLKISESELAARAIEQFLENQAFNREAIAAAITEADKGVFISGEAVERWMSRWADGHDDTFPEPDIFPSGHAKNPT